MTGLPGGSYCNVVDGSSVVGVCTGTAYVERPFCQHQRKQRLTRHLFWCSFTIGNDGSLAVTIGARQAIAVHVGALGIGTSVPLLVQQVAVLFYESATTTDGEVRGNSSVLRLVGTPAHTLWPQQNIFVVGSLPQIGSWDPSNAVRDAYVDRGSGR